MCTCIAINDVPFQARVVPFAALKATLLESFTKDAKKADV